MADIDLSRLSLDELKALQKNVAKAIDDFIARQRAEAIAKAEAAAKEAGFTLAELIGDKAPKAPAAPKYRNPSNTSQTWTGKGRRPKWFLEALAQGKTPEDLAI